MRGWETDCVVLVGQGLTLGELSWGLHFGRQEGEHQRGCGCHSHPSLFLAIARRKHPHPVGLLINTWLTKIILHCGERCRISGTRRRTYGLLHQPRRRPLRGSVLRTSWMPCISSKQRPFHLRTGWMGPTSSCRLRLRWKYRFLEVGQTPVSPSGHHYE